MRVRKKKWAASAINDIEQCLTREEAKKYKGQWQSVFRREQSVTNKELYLEIGSGKGKFITELAQKHPDVQLVGIDSEINALCFAAKKVETNNLPISLIYGTAENLTELFAKGEVARIYLNFSTPWPKTAHHKRRLTYPSFLREYAQVLKADGQIILKTDNYDFFQASQAYLKYMGFRLELVKEGVSVLEDVTGVMTEYESRFREQGLAIYQLLAVNVCAAERAELQAKYQATDSPLRTNPNWAFDFAYYEKHLAREERVL